MPVPKKDLAGLRKGLSATRGGFIARLATIFQGKNEIDPAILAYALMGLFAAYLESDAQRFIAQGARFSLVGRRDRNL